MRIGWDQLQSNQSTRVWSSFVNANERTTKFDDGSSSSPLHVSLRLSSGLKRLQVVPRANALLIGVTMASSGTKTMISAKGLMVPLFKNMSVFSVT